jgi:hypothetical protein
MAEWMERIVGPAMHESNEAERNEFLGVPYLQYHTITSMRLLSSKKGHPLSFLIISFACAVSQPIDADETDLTPLISRLMVGISETTAVSVFQTN